MPTIRKPFLTVWYQIAQNITYTLSTLSACKVWGSLPDYLINIFMIKRLCNLSLIKVNMLYLKRLAYLCINALSLNTKFKTLYKYIKINRKYDFNEIYKLSINVLMKNVCFLLISMCINIYFRRGIIFFSIFRFFCCFFSLKRVYIWFF